MFKNRSIKSTARRFRRSIAALSVFAVLGLANQGLAQSDAQDWDRAQLLLPGDGQLNLSLVTSLRWGPDNRLYVTQRYGVIKVYTVTENNGDYEVSKTETINLINGIDNHNDNGDLNNGVNTRQVTAIVATGSATKPVLYVASSDSRVGGPNGDQNLDGNSGVITKLEWRGDNGRTPDNTDFNAFSDAQLWERTDIVRGLPRSEENHATNGLRLTTWGGKDYLLVCQGGNTNAGGPSRSFARASEYALSAAVLSVDLDAIEAMPVNDAGPDQFIYDIPTLDDPLRPNVGPEDPNDPAYTGVDQNDPFGCNDGLNQAMIVENGPVQVFAAGFRDAYDMVVTEEGRVYVTDNGANQGWGGMPTNEGPAVNGVSNVTNDYLTVDGSPNGEEPGGGGTPFNGQNVDNWDHLELVTGIGDATSNSIDNYDPFDYYGGHPTPVRANPSGAGLFTSLNSNEGEFRTVPYDPNGTGDAADPTLALPANWPPVPVSMAHPVEGDFWTPTATNPKVDLNNVMNWSTNTNAIQEYTASNFNNKYKGSLFVGRGNFSGNGDNAGYILNMKLANDGTVAAFEDDQPIANFSGEEFVLGIECQGDFDIFPGTVWLSTYLGANIYILIPKEGGNPTCLQPGEPGFNGADDYDGDQYTNQDEIDNNTDHCASTVTPTDTDGDFTSDLNDNDDDGDGIFDRVDKFQVGADNGLNNNIPMSYELEPDGDLGGVFGFTGLMINYDENDDYFNWYDGPETPKDIYGGTAGIMTLYMEGGDARTNDQQKGFQFGMNVDANTAPFFLKGEMIPTSGVFHNPLAGQSYGMFVGNGDQDNYIKIVRSDQGITVGMEDAGTYTETHFTWPGGITFKLDWYFLVDPSAGTIAPGYDIDESGTITYVGSPIAAPTNILSAINNANTPLAWGIMGTKGDASNDEYSISYDRFEQYWENPPATQVLYRVNVGGEAITATDAPNPDWEVDTDASPVSYRVSTVGAVYTNAEQSAHPGPINMEHASLDGINVPQALFNSERWDNSVLIGNNDQEELQYEFAVAAGTEVTVRLYFAEIYSGVTNAGTRVFDVALEGTVPAEFDDIDPFAIANAASTGVMVEATATVSADGILDIDCIAGLENPNIKGIEIIGGAVDPDNRSITISTNNTTYTAPATVLVNAMATLDNGDLIDKVEIFEGNNLVGQAVNAPHSFTSFNFTWLDVAAGTYDLTAVATFVSGDQFTSNIQTITVAAEPNDAPTVVITGPEDSEVFDEPATVAISADASDTDGTVTLVEFFSGSTKIGEASAAPFNFSWTNVGAGSYSLTAVATDDDGAQTTSAAVAITVNGIPNEAPTASITSPSNNDEFTAPATITINANANDTDGTVTLVEFFNGTTKIGEDNSSPFSFDWPSVAEGTYSLTVVATDNDGAQVTSSAVSVTVLASPGNDCGGDGVNPAEYSYELEENGNSLTITFIPSSSQYGGGFCFLDYYLNGTKVGSHWMPGNPNKSFTINGLNSGTLVEWFFKYSAPYGQHDPGSPDHSHTMGDCASSAKLSHVGERTSSLKLYPNPTDGIINMDYNGAATIEITNSNGAVVFDQAYKAGQAIVFGSNLAPGVYYVKVTTDTEVIVETIVKN